MHAADQKPLRWGILGAADIAIRRVIPAMHAARHTTPFALASRNAARAKDVAAQLGIPRAYGSYEDLLADPDVDAIYIPLPNTLHAEWTIRSAEAGKHVLCEKPLAASVAECEAMLAACHQAGVQLMEGFMYRFHPQHARVRAMVAAGLIGQPTLIRTTFCVRMQRPPDDIRFSPTLGGGSLLDVGVYALDAARWLATTAPQPGPSSASPAAPAASPLAPAASPVAPASPPVAPASPPHPLGRSADPLAISGHLALDAHGVDLSAAATLAFPDHLLAAVTCSFQAAGGGSYEILGPQGKISVHHAFAPPLNTPARITCTTPDGQQDETFPPNLNQYALMLEAFAEAILTNAPAPIPAQSGIGNIAIVEQLRILQRSGARGAIG
jgi:xylose dehydrogenase (NAD/NADP)